MGRKFIDLIDKEFGRLIVKKIYGKNKHGGYLWECKCQCGNIHVVSSNLLKKGKTKSCGCLQKEITKERCFKHGMSKIKFYLMWSNLKARCNGKNKYYGGRSITYDPKWKTFEGFKKDMWFKYLYAIRQGGVKKPSIERKDINRNYNKENCIFIERKNQQKNTRRNKWFKAISPKGKIYKSRNQSDFAKRFNLFNTSISACLLNKRKTHKKWKFEFIYI